MNSYVIKNLVLFVGVVLVSIMAVGTVQYLSLDREVVFKERKELEKINEKFTSKIQLVIEEKFRLINFLTNTAYPEVAVTFGMFDQFNKVIDQLDNDLEPLNIILIDSKGNVSRVMDEALTTLITHFDSNDFNINPIKYEKNHVMYIKPFYNINSKVLTGYLIGICPLKSIINVIENAYKEITFNYSHFKPKVILYVTDSSRETNRTKRVFPIYGLGIKFTYSDPISRTFMLIRKDFITIMIVAGCILFIFSILLYNSLKRPVNELIKIVSHVSNREDENFKDSIPKDPLFKKVANALLEMHSQRSRLEEEKRSKVVSERLIEIAAQVAHDIKSPLAALTMMIAKMSQKIPEAERISLRSSAKRIQDIVNNLSQMKERTIETALPKIGSKPSRVELLSSLTENVISEKRTQYRDRQGVVIEEHFDESSYGAFAAIEPVEFKRVISNLVNNAVEALKDTGTVTISLSATKTDVILAIADTGQGIPRDRIDTVFDRGVSFDKKHGSGLGLAHAQETMEKMKGCIRIESEVGIGTTVTLVFKRAESPAWFLPSIMVNPRTNILILDDDQSIHDIWKTRFRDYDLADGDIRLLHFTTARSFSEWYKAQRFPKCLILSDYELIGEPETGLDVIEKHSIGRESILVTSHCEDSVIQKRCETLGVRLLPKGLAYLVPIEVHLREVYDAIFIGRDNSLELHWKLSAQEHNKEVCYYSRAEDFVLDAKTIDRNVPVYIGERVSEDQYIHTLYRAITDYGFTKVFVTADDPDKIHLLPWITGVIDKNPPWVRIN